MILSHPAKRKRKVGRLELTQTELRLRVNPASGQTDDVCPLSMISKYKSRPSPPCLAVEVEFVVAGGRKKTKTLVFELTTTTAAAAASVRTELERWKAELSKVVTMNIYGSKERGEHSSSNAVPTKATGIERRGGGFTSTAATGGNTSRVEPKPTREVEVLDKATYRRKLLTHDDHLRSQYQELVETNFITAEEFWDSRERMLKNERTAAAAAAAAASSSSSSSLSAAGVPVGDAKAGTMARKAMESKDSAVIRKTVTPDEMIRIFLKYPHVQRAYEENVPIPITEEEFWTKYFRAVHFYEHAGQSSSSSSSAPPPSASSFFHSYQLAEEAEASAQQGMDARKRAHPLDRRVDLRLSEGYERYAEEELQPLLRREQQPQQQEEEEEEARRQPPVATRINALESKLRREEQKKNFSKYNRLGRLLLSSSEGSLQKRLKPERRDEDTPSSSSSSLPAAPAPDQRGKATSRDPTAKAAETAAAASHRHLQMQKSTMEELRKDLELRDLEHERKKSYKNILRRPATVASSSPSPSPSPSSLPRRSDPALMDVRRAYDRYQHSVSESARMMRKRGISCDEPWMSIGPVNRNMLLTLTSNARGQALAEGAWQNKARFEMKRAGDSRANDERERGPRNAERSRGALKVFSSGAFRKDVRVPEDSVEQIKKFTKRANGYLRFYWSLFPPKNKREFEKMKAISDKLSLLSDKLQTYRKSLLQGDRAALKDIVLPLIESLEVVQNTQAQVAKRVHERGKKRPRRG